MKYKIVQYYSFPYLCAATPILSKLRDPKNDDVKIANASTNGWQRRRGPMNLRRNINHPLETKPRLPLPPRDNVNMTVSYLCGFLFIIIKDHKVKHKNLNVEKMMFVLWILSYELCLLNRTNTNLFLHVFNNTV